MNIADFTVKKYGNYFVDTKQAVKEFRENEKKKKKFFALKKAKKTSTFEFSRLQKEIIW